MEIRIYLYILHIKTINPNPFFVFFYWRYLIYIKLIKKKGQCFIVYILWNFTNWELATNVILRVKNREQKRRVVYLCLIQCGEEVKLNRTRKRKRKQIVKLVAVEVSNKRTCIFLHSFTFCFELTSPLPPHFRLYI